MNAEAEIIWIAELQRRQDEHIAEVRRRLAEWPVGEPVILKYGPGLKVCGLIEVVYPELIQLWLTKDWTCLVPLLQVEAIGCGRLDTEDGLERPPVSRVVRRVLRMEDGGR